MHNALTSRNIILHYKLCINWPKVITTQVDADVDLSEATISLFGAGYVQVSIPGITEQIPLHRFVMGLRPGDKRQVDHVNGDKRDNRRCNLRVVTCQENHRFRGPSKLSKTGLKGVIKLKSGRYRAEIGERLNGKRTNKNLGTFATKEGAGMAYDRAAVTRFAGCFLNYPKRIHQSFQTCLS